MAGNTRVVVAGYGRLGAELARGLAQASGIELAGIARRHPDGEHLTIGGQTVPVMADVAALLDAVQPHVLVEASLPDAAPAHARAALERGIAAVIATSGLATATVTALGDLCQQTGTGAVVAPNLSLGAVVLMHLATVASRFFDSVDIIEMHRDKKADAPSGTALHTARMMAAARGDAFTRAATHTFTLPEVRGGTLDGIGIHSIRLPGLVAHQEVIFGGLGQTLTLRHDATSNESYVPGLLLAIQHVRQSKELTVGLGTLLGLA